MWFRNDFPASILKSDDHILSHLSIGFHPSWDWMKCHLFLDRCSVSIITSWVIALFLMQCSVNNLLDLAAFCGQTFFHFSVVFTFRSCFWTSYRYNFSMKVGLFTFLLSFYWEHREIIAENFLIWFLWELFVIAPRFCFSLPNSKIKHIFWSLLARRFNRPEDDLERRPREASGRTAAPLLLGHDGFGFSTSVFCYFECKLICMWLVFVPEICRFFGDNKN